jgi:hypothetical protein
MSRSCEFCGGEIQEFARTRNHVWIGCRHCQRTWREDLDAASTMMRDPERVLGAQAAFSDRPLASTL